RDKFGEAYTSCAIYYDEHGDSGLRKYVKSELHRCAEQVRERIRRNVFLEQTTSHSSRSPGAPGERSAPTPSPGIPGEGRGEGSSPSADRAASPQNSHPNPLPEYRERGQEAEAPAR